jgi:hypothetical protein
VCRRCCPDDLWSHHDRGVALAKALINTRQQLVDTLGNLTLLTDARNPSLGNSGWSIKRRKLNESLLALNRDIAAAENWDESEIGKRAADLASVANRLWPAM